MRSDKASRIVSGETKYSLGQFKEDLSRNIDWGVRV